MIDEFNKKYKANNNGGIAGNPKAKIRQKMLSVDL
jgi:hypothetical protein